MTKPGPKTDTPQRIAEVWQPGMTSQEIADLVGVTAATVRHHLRQPELQWLIDDTPRPLGPIAAMPAAEFWSAVEGTLDTIRGRVHN